MRPPHSSLAVLAAAAKATVGIANEIPTAAGATTELEQKKRENATTTGAIARVNPGRIHLACLTPV
jgi:hypothetical protein